MDVSEQSSVCKTTPFAATFADSTKEAEVENEKAQKAPEAELSDIQKLTQELTSLNVFPFVSTCWVHGGLPGWRSGCWYHWEDRNEPSDRRGVAPSERRRSPRDKSDQGTPGSQRDGNVADDLGKPQPFLVSGRSKSKSSQWKLTGKLTTCTIKSFSTSSGRISAKFTCKTQCSLCASHQGPCTCQAKAQQSQQSGYPGALAAQMAARAAQVSGPSRPCGPCGPWVHSTHCVEAIFPEPVQGGQGVQGVQALPPAEVSAIFDPGVDTQVWFLEEFFSGFIGNSVKPMNCEHRARNSGNLKRNAWKWLQVVTWLLSCQKFQTARESQQNTFFLGMPCLRCRRASESLRQHLCQSCSRQRKCLRDASRSDADARCSEGWHDLKIGRSCKSEAKQRNCMELWTMMEGFLQGVRDLKVAKTHKTFLFLSFPLKLCRKSHRMSGKAYKAKWEHLRTSRQNEYSENFEATFEHGPAWTSRSSMLLRRGISELNAALLRKDEDIKDHLHPFLSSFYMLHLAHSWTNNIFIIIVLLYVSSLCRCGWLKFD